MSVHIKHCSRWQMETLVTCVDPTVAHGSER